MLPCVLLEDIAVIPRLHAAVALILACMSVSVTRVTMAMVYKGAARVRLIHVSSKSQPNLM